ncbi:hypothetical protein FHG87_020958 [Trinorchestia longiramus]|nr:hypothetical protein FHG87_020958 [Trinorchestia longiramus]
MLVCVYVSCVRLVCTSRVYVSRVRLACTSRAHASRGCTACTSRVDVLRARLAWRFKNEDKNCCHDGNVSVPALQPYPEARRDLLEGNDQEYFIQKKHQELQLCILFCVFWSQTARPSWLRSLLLSHPRPDLSLNDKSVPW